MARQNAKWTLCDDSGQAIIEFTSFISADIRGNARAVSVPIEQGSFSSYNKVQEPLEITATLAMQGSSDELNFALGTLDYYKQSTEIFTVVTPDNSYPNMTLESYSYSRRREDGVNVVYAELHCVEIRSISTQYVALPVDSCKRASDASTTNSGQKQEESALYSLLSGEKESVKK